MSASSSNTARPLAQDPRLRFDGVYQDHFRFVWSTLLRLGVPRDAVEDACQETFLVFYRRRTDFDGRGSPRAWLFGIARRVAYRARRSQHRTQRKISALKGERRVARPLEDVMAEQQLSALLLDALEAVDDEKREALTLHVFEEMTGPEVAAVLGLNVDTAYSRIKAGRRALERVLGARGVDVDMVELVRATRGETEPTPAARARIAALLSAPLGPATTSIGVLGGVWKGLALAAGLGIVVAGAAVHTSDLPRVASIRLAGAPALPPPKVDRAPPPEPPTHATLPVVASPASEPLGAPLTPKVPSGSAGSSTLGAEAERPVGLGAEVELIERATSALRRADAEEALAILGEHDRRFPRGQLADERRVYRAVALCLAGKKPQGRAEGRLIRASRPSKALLVWLDDACGPTE